MMRMMRRYGKGDIRGRKDEKQRKEGEEIVNNKKEQKVKAGNTTKENKIEVEIENKSNKF